MHACKCHHYGQKCLFIPQALVFVEGSSSGSSGYFWDLAGIPDLVSLTLYSGSIEEQAEEL